ncbi:MAG: protein kinase family protein [Fibrobacterales bacterium]
MNKKKVVDSYIVNVVSQYSNYDLHVAPYQPIYENVGHKDLKEIFVILHAFLNDLFIYLNSRIGNGHYTAHESRDLIQVIDHILELKNNLMNSECSFTLNDYYGSKIDECKSFLSTSGGSEIPFDFERINIMKISPMFLLDYYGEVVNKNIDLSFPRKIIGGGSYANVSMFHDSFYDKIFAIKRIKEDLSAKEIERFKNEFLVMKKINSPYVLEVYKYIEALNEYIMEYADFTLHKYILERNNKIDKHGRVAIIRQILKAFDYLSQKNILHRDISPTNILLKQYDDALIVKLSDFGLVKSPENTLTSVDSSIKGAYNDPNLLLQGFSSYTMVHETYALTRVILFVLTGKSNFEKLKNPDIKGFLEKGMSADESKRFQNVSEMSVAFKELIVKI